MPVMKMLRELDQKFSWSFFGFLLAIALGLFTLYDRLLVGKNPQLYLDVLTSASVLDIKEDLPKLDISFDGIAIRQQNLSLRILSIKAINDSSQDILKVHYDPDDPVGLRISSGKIIRTELTDTSNHYLQKNLSFSSPTNNTIHFKDVIFEAHQYFVVKLLVLHPVDEVPSVKSVGHVAGMKEIIVREPYRERTKVSFWSRTFAGMWVVQAVRLISYFVLAILCILLVVIPVSLIGNKVDEVKRRRHVRDFKAATTLSLNENDEFIFNRYIQKGFGNLMAIQQIADSDKALNRAHTCYVKSREKKVAPDSDADVIIHSRHAHSRHVRYTSYYQARIFSDLLESGFVKVDGDSPSVDTHMKETLGHFVRYLKNTGAVPSDERVARAETLEKMIAFEDETLETMDAEPEDPGGKQSKKKKGRP